MLIKEETERDRERRARQSEAIDKYIKSLHMEDHEFKHHNNAIGIDIEGKEHYKEVMLKGGFVPYEESIKLALANRPKRKEYKPSPLLVSFLRHLSTKPRTKNGEIRFSGKEIQAMKKLGVNFDQYIPEYIKRAKPKNGGICAN